MGVTVFPLADENARISSDYGKRTAPKAGASTDHKGIDYAVKTGTQVYAANSGTVETGYNATSGNWLSITGSDGIKTVYRHLSSIQTKTGAAVAAGDPVALSGATGNVTGAHLHFEVLQNGIYIDPKIALAQMNSNNQNDFSQLAESVTAAVSDIENVWPLVLAALVAIGLLKR